MKSPFLKSAVALTIAASLNLATVATAQTPPSPTGLIWDCLISGGGQKGIAFLTFSDDFTFTGYEILVPSHTESINRNDMRNFGIEFGRGNLLGTNSAAGTTNLFGFGSLAGQWAYDYRGRLIGNSEDLFATNSFSFSGTVVPGKRLTLVASTKSGKVSYRGIPYVQTKSLSGGWQAIRKAQGQAFYEFFTLTPFAENNPFPDFPSLADFPGLYYTMDGQGPAYEVTGFAMLSTQKKAAFTLHTSVSGDTNSVLSATFGSVSSKNGLLKASTKGIQEPNIPISYTAVGPFEVAPAQ